MHALWVLLLSWVAVFSLAGFLLMAIDKWRAIGHEWRIRERTFYKVSIAGGAFGVAIGIEVFRHKTLKGKFLGVVYAASVLWLMVFFVAERLLGLPAF
jgi:uncharacterized membrane protein YsdA (DUF1294 family)